MEISEVSTPAPTYDLSGPTTVQSVSPAPIADFLEGKDGAVPRLLRPSVLRFASALDVYVTFDFPERFEPHTTPLQPQLLWMSTNDKVCACTHVCLCECTHVSVYAHVCVWMHTYECVAFAYTRMLGYRDI